MSTSSISATENKDFESLNQVEFTVDAAETKSLVVNILDDNIVESDETFRVEISGDDVGADGYRMMEVTIEDDDGKLTLVPPRVFW